MRVMLLTPIMDTEKNIFRDEALNRQFNRDGYIVVDFLDLEIVKKFTDFFYLHAPEKFEGTYSSVFFWDESLNSKISELAIKFIQPKVHELLYGWFLEGASYITKYPSLNKSSDFGLHQDFNMIDEREIPSIGLWIPMMDTDKKNGGLCVLPGSHTKFAGTIRGANLPSQYIPITGGVEKCVTFLNIRAGEACFFFHSLFHGSLNNFSGDPRVILHAGLFPDDSVPLHFLECVDDFGVKKIEMLKFNRLDYYKNINAYLADPKSFPYQVVGTVSNFTPKPSAEDVLKDYLELKKSKITSFWNWKKLFH